METKSIRIAWCDIYKAIVIILVVIGHTRGGILSNIIYQFHMAAFFGFQDILLEIREQLQMNLLENFVS